MDEVGRFIADLQQIFARVCAKRDELEATAHRKLASFVGGIAVRGDQYAPSGEISRQLVEARRSLQGLSFEGEARFVRVALLTELDRTIALTDPGPLPNLKP
jgi:phage host-nuclease inhibitor protein Gam